MGTKTSNLGPVDHFLQRNSHVIRVRVFANRGDNRSLDSANKV